MKASDWIAVLVPVGLGVCGVIGILARIMWWEIALSRKRFHDINNQMTGIIVNLEVIANRLEIELPFKIEGKS